MPHIKDHEAECIRQLGDPFHDVNIWMDEFAKYGIWTHRGYRHHWEGIEEVKRIWGDKAAKAAVLHVMMDCDGYIPTKSDYATGKVNNFGVLDQNHSIRWPSGLKSS